MGCGASMLSTDDGVSGPSEKSMSALMNKHLKSCDSPHAQNMMLMHMSLYGGGGIRG